MASTTDDKKRPQISTRLLTEADIPEVTKLFVDTQYANAGRFFGHHTWNARYLPSAVPFGITIALGLAAAAKTRTVAKPIAATVAALGALTGIFYLHWVGIVRGFAHMCLKAQMQPAVLKCDYIDNPTHAFVIAVDEVTKKIVGCVCIHPFSDQKPHPHALLAPASAGFTEANTCELIRMCVDPSVQGAGIGPKLVTAVEAEARRMGFENVFLSTSCAQIPAHKLYTRCGYVRLGGATIYPPFLKLPLDLYSYSRKI